MEIKVRARNILFKKPYNKKMIIYRYSTKQNEILYGYNFKTNVLYSHLGIRDSVVA